MSDRKKTWAEIVTKHTETMEEPTQVAPEGDNIEVHSTSGDQNSQSIGRAVLGTHGSTNDSSHPPEDPPTNGHSTQRDEQRASSPFRISKPTATRGQVVTVSANVDGTQQPPIRRPGSRNLRPPFSFQYIPGHGRGGPPQPYQHWIPMGRSQYSHPTHGQHSRALLFNPDVVPPTLNHSSRQHHPFLMQGIYNYNYQHNARSYYNGSFQNQSMYLLPSVYNINLNLNPNYHHHHYYHGYNEVQYPSVLLSTNGWPTQIIVDTQVPPHYSNPIFLQYGSSVSDHTYYANPCMTASNLSNYSANTQAGQPYHLFPMADSHHASHATAENLTQPFYAPHEPTSREEGTNSYEPLFHSSIWGTPQVSNNPWGDGNSSSQLSNIRDQPLDLSLCSAHNDGDSNLSYFTNSTFPPHEKHGTTDGLVPGEVSSRHQTQGPQGLRETLEFPNISDQILYDEISSIEEEEENKTGESCHDKLKKSNCFCKWKDDEEDGNGNPSSNAKLE